MTRSERKQLWKGLSFTSPWLIGFFVFTLLPIGLSLYYSLCDYSLLQGPHFIGLRNYQWLAEDAVFWKSLKVTGYYALLALPAGMAVSLGLAMMLNVKTRSQTVYRAIIFIPSLVPLVASAMVWLWMYNPQLGLLNLFLERIGVVAGALLPPGVLLVAAAVTAMALYRLRRSHLPKSIAVVAVALIAAWLYVRLFTASPHPWLERISIKGPGWLTEMAWTIPALTLMSVWSVGYTVVIYLAGLQDVPVELYEAAELDGAGTWRRLWHVTLPMLSPVIFFNLITSIIATLQVFDRPLIVTNNGQPNRSAYFLTMYVYDKAFRYLQMGYASAMAWVQLVIVLALTALAFWSSKRWVHYQGK